MAGSQGHVRIFESIPCLREYAPAIATYMSERGPERSALALRDRFEAFANWAEEVERQENRQLLRMPIDASDLVSYARALDERGMAMSTISSYVSAIGTMHTAAGLYSPTADMRVRATIAKLKEKHAGDELRSARSLSEADIEAILSRLYTPRKTSARQTERPETTYKRASVDKAMMLTMIQAGMRRNEAARLVWGDVREEADGSGRVLLRTNWPNQREVWVAITESCLQALKNIMPNGADDSSRVFSLSGSQITMRLKRMCAEAGIDPTDVSGHTPRTTLLRLMMEKGAPVDMLQRQLRRAPPSLTEKYVDSLDDRSTLRWLRRALRITTVANTD